MAAGGAKGMGFSGTAVCGPAAFPSFAESLGAKKDRGGVYAHDKFSKGLMLETGTVYSSPRQPGLGRARGKQSRRGVPSRVPGISPPLSSDSQPCLGKELVVLPLPTPDFQAPAHSSA